ncbi:MAG: hypothetical protein KF760_08405 [Candidatus Eremiobacteraeota bacterium]|nr:hypothetical protein [Candidatus Eremiobacteraeota bacterium]MCW5870894.1 hypothetical protein [Candidatus Eremiobacteraeota bacterium]
MRWLLLLVALTVPAQSEELWRDVIGDGRPERVILHDLGGTYPVMEVSVFQGKRKLAEATLYHARLADLDGDGRFEFLATDPEVGPHKEFPTYVLRCGPHGLQPAPELMRKLPAPTEKEILALIQLAREQPFYDYPLPPVTEVRKMANRLTYSGRGQQLPALLARIWSPDHCRAFLQKYQVELRESKLWPLLQALNLERKPLAPGQGSAPARRAPSPQSFAPQNRAANRHPRD